MILLDLINNDFNYNNNDLNIVQYFSRESNYKNNLNYQEWIQNVNMQLTNKSVQNNSNKISLIEKCLSKADSVFQNFQNFQNNFESINSKKLTQIFNTLNSLENIFKS